MATRDTSKMLNEIDAAVDECRTILRGRSGNGNSRKAMARSKLKVCDEQYVHDALKGIITCRARLRELDERATRRNGNE